MRTKSNLKGLQGSVTIYNRVLRLRGMNEEEIKKRLEILDFSRKHGYSATEDAFKVNRRTVQRWRKLLKQNNGHIQVLSSKSRRPKRFRPSGVRQEIRDEILNQRKQLGILGPAKIHIILKKYFKPKDIPSVPTITRIIREFKTKGLLPRRERLSLNGRSGKLHRREKKKQTKLRKQKGEEVFQTDTVIRHFCNIKLYTLTGIDTKTKTAFAKCYLTHKSEKTKDFIETCIKDFPIKKIQTDNGSEFAKHFKETLKENQIVHYHSYPRCPKMNAHVERFNRTLSEDFLEKEKYTALTDLNLLNQKLQEYLNWYNNERPHKSLNYLTPKEYMLQLNQSDKCV